MPSLPAQRLTRGVYKAPYLVNGFEVLFAVDRNGVARKHLKLTQLMNDVRATRWLELWLDRVDPPTVHLTDAPTSSGWPYDHEALPPTPVKLMPVKEPSPLKVY